MRATPTSPHRRAAHALRRNPRHRRAGRGRTRDRAPRRRLRDGHRLHQRRRLPADDEAALGARYVSLPELMARSDYVVVQLPLNDETRGIIGRDLIERTKPGAMLVNVARAELIDRDAVVAALASGRLAGFGLDVGLCGAGRSGRSAAALSRPQRDPHAAHGDRRPRQRAGRSRGAVANLWRAIVRRERG